MTSSRAGSRPTVPIPRTRRALLRDPDLPKIFVAALLVSVLVGAIVWYAGSSRGGNVVEVQEAFNVIGLAFTVVLGLGALVRAFVVSDLRLAAILVATIVGWTAAGAVAFRVTPGDTTDGTIAITGPPAETGIDLASPAIPEATPDLVSGARFGGPSRCDWDGSHTRLLRLTSRRPFAVGDPPPFPARVTIDFVAGTVTIERVKLEGNQLVAAYAGTFPPTQEAAGHVTVSTFQRTVATGLDADTSLLVDLLADLDGWIVSWDCPHFG